MMVVKILENEATSGNVDLRVDDIINAPDHYVMGRDIEPITVIETYNLCYHLGNIVKYLSRCGRKDNIVTNLQKARWYLNRELLARSEEPCCHHPYLNIVPSITPEDIIKDWKLPNLDLENCLSLVLHSRIANYGEELAHHSLYLTADERQKFVSLKHYQTHDLPLIKVTKLLDDNIRLYANTANYLLNSQGFPHLEMKQQNNNHNNVVPFPNAHTNLHVQKGEAKLHP